MSVAGAVRAEWRAAEEEWSRAALEHWEHGRTLADVLRDCMARGDAVSVAFATTTWSGDVVAVGADIARLAVGPLLVDVRLFDAAPFVLRTRPSALSSRSAGGAVGGVAAVTTFTARLRELDGTQVCIGIPDGRLEGILRAGNDQVRLADRDGSLAYVPIGSVSWVRSLDDD